MKYLNQCRIQRAQALLINTERQLKMEISLEASGSIG
jgi:transcriptional regulator GlxA family with amidase domain